MVRQESTTTMLRSAKLKTKRGSSTSVQNSSLKGYSKQTGRGPKTGLAKSKPGFALYSDEEVKKSAPKFKGPVKSSSQGPTKPHQVSMGVKAQGPIVVRPPGPVVARLDPFEGMMRADDVISQMQLVEKMNREEMIKSTDTKEGPNLESVLPEIDRNPAALPEVRTPFNKRLISSTPDPERFVAMDNFPSHLEDNSVKDNPRSNLSPQMVPEKDTDTNTKTSLSTLDEIGAMLSQQRQNQLIWQQQLEQFKNPEVMKVTELPTPSAFQPWQGTITGLNSGQGLKSFNIGEMEIGVDGQDGHLKAKWVSEEIDKSTRKSQQHSMNESSKTSEIDSISYNGYGVTSTQMTNSAGSRNNEAVTCDNVSSQNLKTSDVNKKFSNNSHMSNDKVSIAQSEIEMSSQNKKIMQSSRINTVKTKSGVKVLPVAEMNRQDNPESSAKSSALKKITSKKSQPPKVLENTGESGTVKKKKILHVNLPRDERGMDVPPTNISVDEINYPLNEDPKNSPAVSQLEKDAATIANNSISTCGGEVNTLLSNEPVESNRNSVSDADTETVSNEVDKDLQQSEVIPPSYLLDAADKQMREDFEYTGMKTDDYVMYNPKGNVEKNELVIDMAGGEVNKKKNDDNEEENVNQNYHDEEEIDRRRSNRFRLHYLEKMADKTLMDIACRLTLKATAVRDKELRDLIDDMIFHTDATLAREIEGVSSSHAFLMDENNILKKRLHTVNKQLEAKERQERQADMYPTVSNTDVMHLERKNLYLRQEKDRLDNQVTNLLEEKAKWLVKQQDLVKTISVKDREILKLEEKHQEDKKTLHKAVDEAAKNSQGVHFKLSVADMEIANLSQRLKTRDQEIADLKDTLKDTEEDLKCCTDSRRDKNKEIQRLQDLVNTLKMGVDEVMKAYEATAQSQPSTNDQRQGIESLRRLVSETISASTSLSNIPEQFSEPRTRRKSSERNDREFSMSTSRRQQLPCTSKAHPIQGGKEQLPWKQPSQQLSKRTHKGQGQLPDGSQSQHPSQHQQSKMPPLDRDRDRPSRNQSKAVQRPQRERNDWLNDSSLLKLDKKGARQKHDSGTTLTVEALKDHDRRHSPIDRSLWHSLDTGHVMPPFSGEEPYHSDSEIHVANSRNKRGMDQDRNFINPNARFRQRRRSDDFTDRGIRNQAGLSDMYGEIISDRPNIVDRVEQRDNIMPGLETGNMGRVSRNARRDDVELSRENGNRGLGSSVRNWTDYADSDVRVGEELESFPLNADNETDVDRSRYSVTDYFKKYPQGHQASGPPHRFPMSSKDYWVDSGTAEDQDVLTMRPREESRSQHHSHQFSDLESTSVSDRQDVYQDNVQDFDLRAEPIATSTQRQPTSSSVKNSSRDGNIIQTMEKSGSRSQFNQPLSTSYPLLRPPGGSQPLTSANDQQESLMSMSLPHTSRQYSGRNHRGNAASHDRFDQNSKDQSMSTRHQISDSNRRDQSMSTHYPNVSPRRHHRSKQDSNTFDNNQTLEDEIARATDRFVERVLEDGRLTSFSNRPCVTFRDPSEESLVNPPQSFQSDFMNGRTSFPPHSSPVNTSDISVSRRATRGSETSQHDFFRGTELSASYSSISETDVLNNENSNNQKTSEYAEESFHTGIASLDLKIAKLEAKINHTKSIFS